MRIIAGAAKGRRLFAPPGSHTRPTADRVREALFSVLATRLAAARVLDAFAGSGALGLEALSRGAEAALFIEQDAAALKALRHNMENCGLAGAEIWAGDTLRFLRNNKEKRFDIIFLDPPYHTELLTRALAAVLEGGALAEEGLIVAETAAKQQLTPPAGLTTIKYSVYGDTALYYIEAAGQRRKDSN